jgi:hypothetical protein
VLFARVPRRIMTESIIWVAVERCSWPLLLAMLIVGGIVPGRSQALDGLAAAAVATLVVEALALLAGYFVFRHKERRTSPKTRPPPRSWSGNDERESDGTETCWPRCRP